VKLTHDMQEVHEADAVLPEGAHGWTLCTSFGSAYSTWLPAESQERAREDAAAIERDIAKIRTRDQAATLLRVLGLSERFDTIADACLRIGIAARARLWPLREATAAERAGAR